MTPSNPADLGELVATPLGNPGEGDGLLRRLNYMAGTPHVHGAEDSKTCAEAADRLTAQQREIGYLGACLAVRDQVLKAARRHRAELQSALTVAQARAEALEKERDEARSERDLARETLDEFIAQSQRAENHARDKAEAEVAGLRAHVRNLLKIIDELDEYQKQPERGDPWAECACCMGELFGSGTREVIEQARSHTQGEGEGS